LETLPDGPGVYLWKDARGEVLYVGKAKRLKSRVRSYIAADFATSPKNDLLQRLIADVETIVVGREAESLLLENNLIKEYRPRFNVRLKDDKSYPSIAVTLGEPFPRVLVTRRRNIEGAKYFGPYTDVAQLRRTLAIIRRIYTMRSCSDDLPRERRERPCLDYHIGKCRAPCVGWQSQEDYRAMVNDVVDFLEGRTNDVRQKVREVMLAASDREDFERAARLRDALRWLERLEEPSTVELIGTGEADVIGYARDGDDAVGVLMRVREGRVISRDHKFLEGVEEETDEAILSAFLVRYYVPAENRVRKAVLPFPPDDFDALREILPDTDWTVPQRGTASRWRELADQNARHLLESLRIESFETEERAEDPVYGLGRDLGLSVVPRSLVCVDISNNQGRDMVGSLVWFEAGRPKKSEYRKFKIKGVAQQDDFAAIHEVITRYLTRRRDEGTPLPDLMLIDGPRCRAPGGFRQASDGEPGQARGGNLPSGPLRRLAAVETRLVSPSVAAGTGRSSPVRCRIQPEAADPAHHHLGAARDSRRRSGSPSATPGTIREPRRRALGNRAGAGGRSGLVHRACRTHRGTPEHQVVTHHATGHA
jgi:excinuclease ABC subunit C